MREIVEHGRHRGEVRADVQAPIVADLIIGAYFGHYTHQGQPDRGWVDDVIATRGRASPLERARCRGLL